MNEKTTMFGGINITKQTESQDVSALNNALTYEHMLPVVLSTLMKSTTDLSFAKDKNYRYICASRMFAKIAGLENQEDIVGKTDYELFDKKSADKYRSDDESLMSGEKSIINLIECIPSNDSNRHYFSTSKSLLLDENGVCIGIYCVGRDVTEYHDAFGKLKLLTDSIPGGLATYEYSDGNIKIIYYNDGFCRLFGLTYEEYAYSEISDPINHVFKEDMPQVRKQLDELFKYGTPVDCAYRIHIINGGYKWISHKAVVAEKSDGKVIINALLQDITEQRDTVEKLRQSEEENNIAIRLGNSIICRYAVGERTLILSSEVAASLVLPEKVTGIPYNQVQLGMVSPESADNYIRFFENISNGSKSEIVVFQYKYLSDWLWLEAKSRTVFSDSGEPVKAVISFSDITEMLEKETVYKKWQQSLHEKNPESYTLFRCNISNDDAFDTMDGSLLNISFDEKSLDFGECTKKYVEQCVFIDDKEKYLSFMNSDTMLANYYRGKRSGELEYREILPDGNIRWLKLSIELVEYPNSADIEAYLMYENINDTKKLELQRKELAETDPLTGVLNRTTFASMVTQIICSSKPDIRHALIMLDIDGFKQVNDVFGHAAGDQALIDIADTLSSVLRRDDVLGRLGGDEFVVFLSDIPDDSVAENKARQICALVRKSFSMEVQISGSIGVSIAMRDGTDFDTLYKKADAALYYVKGSGKDSYALYCENMISGHSTSGNDNNVFFERKKNQKKRRMLVVDDNNLAHELMTNIFKDEFIVEKAKDGNTALIRLRHYGSAISVVLLDLMMTGMDGFAVLEKIRSGAELRAIPVIIVSGDESRETCLKTIRSGATDFITKPVDPELLRIRVYSAISKAENERLRAKNSYLELQNEERIRYETALENAGIAIVECNWLNGAFSYSPTISDCLAGTYDDRTFWHILLSDMVADTLTVQNMQNLVHNIADNRAKTYGSTTVILKTPTKGEKRFRMNVRKLTDEFQLTNKMIITLIDLDYIGRTDG